MPETAEQRTIRELRDEIHELREEVLCYLVITPSGTQGGDPADPRGK